MKLHNNLLRYLVFGLLVTVGTFIVLWRPVPGSAATPAHQFSGQSKGSDQILPGVVVVKMKVGATAPSGGLLKSSGRTAQVLRQAGILSVRKAFPSARQLSAAKLSAGMIDLSSIYFASIGAGQDPVVVAGFLDHSSEFEYAEPKYMSHIFATPNDPAYAANQSLYFRQMNAEAGWSVTKGDSNVVIADVDGGTFWQHPDLQANLWINKAEDANHDRKFEPTASSGGGDDNGVDDDNNGFVDDVIGWNFANNSNNPLGLSATPFNGSHGTATASHFGAVTNNSTGMTGASWNCKLMPINTSSAQADGDIQYGYEGIHYASANGASVIKCSWGRTGSASRLEQDIIDAATQAGALVVAAAGNDGVNNDYLAQYPASYRNVLAVGAVLSGSDTKAFFSDYGLTVPVYAPGTDIWSAFTDGTYGDGGSGTSYSTPLTSGLAGLVKSLHPTWTPRQIATQIRMTTDSIDPTLGHGRINYGRALTETHAGIEILSSSLLTPGGNKLFLPGDTVVLHVTVKNIMYAPATNLSFTPGSSNTVLQAMQGSTPVAMLAAGDSVALPPLLFKVGSMTASTPVLVTLNWRYLTGTFNESDAFDFRINVFPDAPAWDVVQSSTLVPLFSVFAVDKNILWAAGGNQQATAPVVTRSLDGGATWADGTGNLPGVDLYCINAIDSMRAWVGSGDGRIFATTDGGTAWVEQSYPAPQSPFIDAIKIFPDLSGYALGDPAGGGKFVVLHTTNGGLNWNHLASEPVGATSEAGWNNSFFWTDESHGWFGTNDINIWRTTNGGATWSAGTAPIAGSVAVSFSDNLHGVAGFLDTLLAVTSDGGATWSRISSPSTVSITAVSCVPSSPFVWISDDATPFMSTDRGNTWVAQTTFPIAGSILYGTFFDTASGWMVSSFGEILIYHGFQKTVETPVPPLPTQYVLLQNYPNPFNPTTTIRFDVPFRSNVKITIYNILGQQIAEVVSREFQAGTWEQPWRGNVASGIYLCRIEATSSDSPTKKFVDVKKMVLIK